MDTGNSLIDGLVHFVLTMHNAVGAVFILFLLLQVGLVLVGLYMPPIRTRRQFCRVLLILFAGVGICSMTLWLILQ